LGSAVRARPSRTVRDRRIRAKTGGTLRQGGQDADDASRGAELYASRYVLVYQGGRIGLLSLRAEIWRRKDAILAIR
jgi:hypothetical protein